MSNSTFKHEIGSTVMNSVRRVALFLKSVDWAKYAKLLFKITWGVALCAVSFFILIFKALSALNESDDVDEYDSHKPSAGSAYVDHSNGEVIAVETNRHVEF